ncbi:MAG: 50S ribosomal protein L11 methyltransferase [Chitinophagia bacterium]|nr:50S ribosomal protein L11 methyltransferase [Chitinophagia bacterium]
MHTLKISINCADEALQDIYIARLAECGYYGFEQEADALHAYIEPAHFAEATLQELIDGAGYAMVSIAPENWNAVWEANFEPVIIPGYCTIYAPFHGLVPDTPYKLCIMPKMSFGTGHHATTQLMLELMREMDFKGKRVLDFGTGTGVLAIMAEKLGSTTLLAIDNEAWSVENAAENSAQNSCKYITVVQNEDTELPAFTADIILANINRHVLLAFMEKLYEQTAKGGYLLLSGILQADVAILSEATAKAGYQPVQQKEKNGWVAMLLHIP